MAKNIMAKLTNPASRAKLGTRTSDQLILLTDNLTTSALANDIVIAIVLLFFLLGSVLFGCINKTFFTDSSFMSVCGIWSELFRNLFVLK